VAAVGALAILFRLCLRLGAGSADLADPRLGAGIAALAGGMGRPEEARRSLAWALQVSPASLPLPKLDEAATRQTAWSDLFRYARGLLVSWLSNLGMQTTGYGVILWAPTLFVMLLGVSPAQASYLFIFLSLAGFVGRFVFSGLSELIGCGSRRARQAGPRVRIRLPPAASLLRT
jgi:hypothetical protein